MLNQDPNSDLIPFTVADMEFMTAPEIQNALIDYITTQNFGYTQATPDYRNTIVSWYQDAYNTTIPSESVIPTNGVISALFGLIHILTKPNDKILIMTPVYSSFFSTIKETGRRIETTSLLNQNGIYSIDYNDFETKLADDTTTLLILCNPHNPVGRVWTHEELTRIHDLTSKHNVRVVSDEIHGDLIMPGFRHKVYLNYDANGIVLSSASKSFNLAALQCSAIITNDAKIHDAWSAYEKSIGTHGPNALGLVATKAAYSSGKQWLHDVINVIHTNYRYLVDTLNETQCVISPLEGTYLAWVDLNAYLKKDTVLLKHLKEHHLHFNDGPQFGTEGTGFIRINLACPHEDLEIALKRFLKIVNKFK